ncbi:MAG: neutral/alkaline non-lysosomal ceramidase N-terminal domain-containing protein [Bryobacteraceae bacterium]
MRKFLTVPGWAPILTAAIFTAAGAAAATNAAHPVPISQNVSVTGMTNNRWTSNDTTPRTFADVNGDGKPDIVAFAPDGVYVALNQGRPSPTAPVAFGPMTRWIAQFGVSAGFWPSNTVNPRLMADVNNDGAADIIGWANDGIYVALSTKSSFAPIVKWASLPAVQWHDSDRNPVLVADVDGDKKPDFVVFADDGVYVMKGDGKSFAAPVQWSTGYSFNSGWPSNDKFPRLLADVNGDGKADIVGFASSGVYVSLSTGTGFASAVSWEFENYSTDSGWPSNGVTPRMLADVDGDGLPDIVGFFHDGIYVSLNLSKHSPVELQHPIDSNGNSLVNYFSAPTKLTSKYGQVESSDIVGLVEAALLAIGEFPRYAIDLDQDGKADMGTFRSDGIYTYTSPFVSYPPLTGARIDITPGLGGFRYLTAYYGRAGYGTTTVPKLPIPDVSAYPNRVRAIAIKDANGGQPKVIVSADILGFTRAMHTAILGGVQSHYSGFAEENLILNASHTHSGPVLRDNLAPIYSYDLSSSDLYAVGAYTDALTTQIVAAIGNAIDNAVIIGKTGSLYYSFTTASFASYRTTIHGAPNQGEQGNPSELPDVPVMVLEDVNGNVLAVIFTYACHGTSSAELNFHGDWPGVTATRLEQMYPGSVALFVQGAAGDYNPHPLDPTGLGESLSSAITTLISTTSFMPLSGVITAAYQDLNLPLLFSGQNDAINGGSENMPIVAWNFAGSSPLLLIATGGELVSGYALRFKLDLAPKVSGDQKRVWVASYSNEVPGYIASREYLVQGNYEGQGAQSYYGHWKYVDAAIPNPLLLDTTENAVIQGVESVANQVIH